jgi:flagellar motor switch protein FliN
MMDTNPAVATEGPVIKTPPAYGETLPPMPGATPSYSNRAAMQTYPEGTPVEESNLGLVLDVELNVLLRFGQRQLSLREVLDLKCGSVVELDRRVDEPVELLLDGRVIARGEAAIVDGNYGLRVTEVVQSATSSRLYHQARSTEP